MRNMIMNRSFLYFVIGALAVGMIWIGILYYQQSQSGIDIRFNRDGVSIDGN